MFFKALHWYMVCLCVITKTKKFFLKIKKINIPCYKTRPHEWTSFAYYFNFYFIFHFSLSLSFSSRSPPNLFFPIKQTKASHYLSLFLEAAQNWSKQTDNSQSQIKKTQTPLFKTATQHSTLIKILINHFLFLSLKKKRRKNENLLMSWSWIWNHL